jgi:L-threonylcarbamoyladenylate synthase
VTLLAVDPAFPDPEAIALAAAALGAGQLVVIPTDSVYGLAADPSLPAAVARVFEAKGRSRALALPVLVASVAQLGRLVGLDERARRAVGAFWPGAVTLVLPRAEGLAWDLGDRPGTLAVRMPAHPVALEVLTQAGPLAVTSANPTGEPTPDTAAGVRELLGDAVSVYLDAGPSPGGTPSTVLDLTRAEAVILREGAVPAAEVLAALA